MGVSKAGLVTPETRKAYPRSFEEAGAAALAQLPRLDELLGSWNKVRTLGEANFGKVLLVRATPAAGLELPEVFALKRMPRDRVLAGGEGLESALNEILAGLALKGLSLPHTAEVLFAAQDEEFFYLASEYCEHGELFGVLQALVEEHQTGMSEHVLWEVMKEVFQAVESLHAAGVAHRDISLENLLVTKTGGLRLIDFGQAVLLRPLGQGEAWEESAVLPSKRGLPGKEHYRAPELLAGLPYLATKVDAFACGVLLYTLAVGAYPGEDLWRGQERAERCALRPHLEERRLEGRVAPGLLDLLEQLLAPQPTTRPSVAEAARHPWLLGVLDGCESVDVDEEAKP